MGFCFRCIRYLRTSSIIYHFDYVPCAGQPGLQGFKGQAGDTGLQGFTGRSGQLGQPGRSGDPGNPGAIGRPGATGFTGQPGPNGSPGQCTTLSSSPLSSSSSSSSLCDLSNGHCHSQDHPPCPLQQRLAHRNHISKMSLIACLANMCKLSGRKPER